jgi:GT2 family glycosyltransferase/4-amino-4-deoxy-L-arabinose transferase-like glycosyltransferase
MKNLQVSIVIVHYEVEKELFVCVSSIFKAKPNVSFEIIVVDNDQKGMLEKQLKGKFPQVKYIKSYKNVGFGAGNNIGAKSATGKYLLFLNPDTFVEKGAIDELYSFMDKNPNAGMVAPLLLNPSRSIYSDQGSDEYNFINGIVVLSFVNKLFPNNIISRKFFHRNWNKKRVEEFDVVPGTAFIISKELFERSGRFDEKLFLYFEEYDLAKRLRKFGNKNYIIPQAKVRHIWEASTKKENDIKEIFSKSRQYFFKKYYGSFFASVVEFISNFGKHELALGAILVMSIYLGLFRINELMVFIGDQGWFYLSARDLLVNGHIPLVGIASSHPWLHQGAFWTYLLALFLWIFHFNPVSGAYLTVILGVLSVFGIYIVGSKLFSKRIGLIASLLYATSPLVVYNSRFPYHTSPIPLFALALIYFTYKFVRGKYSYLPLMILFSAVLYNFEIATAALWGTIAGILAYLFYKKQIQFRELLNKKNIVVSIFSLVIPLFPMILYDVRNGFPQTLKFAAWIFYKIFSLLGSSQQSFSINKTVTVISFLFNNFTKLIFASSSLIAFIIFVALACWILYSIVWRREGARSGQGLLILLFIIPLTLIIFNQTPSDAYLPMLFPIVVLLFSILFDQFMNAKKALIISMIIIAATVFSNVSYMLENNFALDRYSAMFTLDKRVLMAKEILNMTGDSEYNLVGKGPGSEFKSFTMNYEYLTWWMGHGPSRDNKNFKIYISESASGIKIERNK